MIVPTIRNDEQRASAIARTSHLAEAEINAIEQGSLSLRSGEHHPILQVFDACRKGTGQLGLIMETYQEEFIARIGGS